MPAFTASRPFPRWKSSPSSSKMPEYDCYTDSLVSVKKEKKMDKDGQLCEFTKQVVMPGQQTALSEVQGTLLSARIKGLKNRA
ncbi:hypothetical protein D5086_007274 [Populus alba]|uniref:Uncharacterized protein n=1 Tax=Populus alba TaxID=43335 RepID=A0ACC4CNS2_POPAL